MVLLRENRQKFDKSLDWYMAKGLLNDGAKVRRVRKAKMECA
jgi:hypothetical protein